MSQQGQVKVGSYIYNENDIIGKGSFGKVFKGKCTTNGRVVAVKVIYVESSKQTMLIKMIKNEVEALKRVKSENVVEFLEFAVQNNHVYIVTEFCNQQDLRYHLIQHKILSEKTAVEFLKQMVNAFKECCRQKVFHRDLKPANVLLHNNVCKIADFGFAKTLDSSATDYSSQMVSIVGTPLYMSPQLLDKQKYTTKSDIWSLGIILYEMLFGKVPWVGKDPATYSKNIRGQPLAIDRSVNNISPEVEDLLTQCLQVNEEDRIGWTELFQHALILEGDQSSRSTKEDSSCCDVAEFSSPETKVTTYNRDPVNPSNLMRMHQEKIIGASRSIMASQVELTRTNIDQKLRMVNQFALSQSNFTKLNVNNASINENTEMILKSNTDNLFHMNRFKSGFLRDSKEISPSPDHRGGSSLSKKWTDEAQEEFKKIEAPLLSMKNKITVLEDLFNTVSANEEFKDLPAIKFNSSIAIAKLINSIFKELSSQILTKKVKTRSHMLKDYLDSDNFKHLIVFVETQKKKFDEMLRACSRKLFELKLSSDKEKDEVLDYYQDVLIEAEEQALLGKIVDIVNQMLYQIRFNSQIFRKSGAHNSQVYDSPDKEYFEGLLVLFGDESILESFKYDRVDSVIRKIHKLKEENQ